MVKLLPNELQNDEIKDANKCGIGRWCIERNQTDDQWNVVASKQFVKGELVFSALNLGSHKQRTAHTIQKDWNHHIFIDLPGRFIFAFHNH